VTSVGYGIAFPASRGILTPAPPAPLDRVTGVTVTGAWGFARRMLTSFGGGARARLRDTVTAGESNAVTADDATAFLGGHAGVIVSAYDHSGNGRTFTNATASQQPAFTAALAAANNRAAFGFDASDDVLIGPNLSVLATVGSGYIVAVAICNAFSGSVVGATLFGTNINSYLFTSSIASGVHASFFSGSAISPAEFAGTAGVPFVVEVWWNGTNAFLAVNGAPPHGVACGALGGTNTFVVGKVNYGSATNGSVMEIATMSARPTQADAIVADMKSFYGIA
jgi:hypothetical protein